MLSVLRCVLWETESVKRKIHKHISVPNIGSSFPSNIFEAHTKNVFSAWDVNLFSVLWYDFMNKQTHPIFCNSSLMLFHLELNFKQMLYHKRCIVWKLGCILGYFPVLAGLCSITLCIRLIVCKEKYLMDYEFVY